MSIRPELSTSVGDVSPFAITDELPAGTTLIEASAGSGKTYAIVSLAVRFVAEGRSTIGELLLVTFTKSATRELRDRTYLRFIQCLDALKNPDQHGDSADELIRFLVSDTAQRQARRDRLQRAIGDFDSATISTTVGFCQSMLRAIGIVGDLDPNAHYVHSVEDLTDDVTHDVYLRMRQYTLAHSLNYIDFKDARGAAKDAIGDPQAELMPDEPPSTPAGQLVKFAADCRDTLSIRKQRNGIRDYGDMVELLARILQDDQYGQCAAKRLRQRFTTVFIDEFQDTDPLQWDILRRAFHGHSTLILVGDPKQAIYSFRGAEINSYLDAKSQVTRQRDLTDNWRTDPGLIDGLNFLYAGAVIGGDATDTRKVIRINPATAQQSVSRFKRQPPLTLHVLGRTGYGPISRGFPTLGRLRKGIANDVAMTITKTLDSAASLTLAGEVRPVQAGDMCILVRTTNQIAPIQEALREAGIRSVLTTDTSVLQTPSAEHWLWVLSAIEQPRQERLVKLAALTPIFGYTAQHLDQGGSDLTTELTLMFRDLGRILQDSGFAAVTEAIAAKTEMAARVLGYESGERTLSDIRHIAQIITDESARSATGIAELRRWLSDRIREDRNASESDRSRRLESERNAVKIGTIHSAKGLEYPIVYLPMSWQALTGPREPRSLRLHVNGTRRLHVGTRLAHDYRQARQAAEREERDEELRLLYVAATRAQVQLHMWWAPHFFTERSSLHRILFRDRSDPEGHLPDRVRIPENDAAVFANFTELAALSNNIRVVEVAAGGGEKPTPQPRNIYSTSIDTMRVATFDRHIDTAWRRTSYSALTADAHHALSLTDAAEAELTDEFDVTFAASGADNPRQIISEAAEEALCNSASNPVSLMNDFAGGTSFGSLVHEILEQIDTSVTDLRDELLRWTESRTSHWQIGVDAGALADALFHVMTTPLDSRRTTLAAIQPCDRLAEMDFEFPLAGGDVGDGNGAVTVAHLADLIARHLPDTDPLVTYPERLRDIPTSTLRGFLTGSIDGVFRLVSGGQPRFVIADYKTNRLGSGELTTGHYTAHRMAEAMMDSHYPLQALLYSVAMHRYLRWRLPTYEPEIHLGPIWYLFVRGMVGIDTPPGRGVFEWKPPAKLIVDLSDVLAGSMR